MSHSVSDEELKKAYEVAAKVVATHGETYLPIFERLEREYKARIQTKKALSPQQLKHSSNSGIYSDYLPNISQY